MLPAAAFAHISTSSNLTETIIGTEAPSYLVGDFKGQDELGNLTNIRKIKRRKAHNYSLTFQFVNFFMKWNALNLSALFSMFILYQCTWREGRSPSFHTVEKSQINATRVIINNVRRVELLGEKVGLQVVIWAETHLETHSGENVNSCDYYK